MLTRFNNFSQNSSKHLNDSFPLSSNLLHKYERLNENFLSKSTDNTKWKKKKALEKKMLNENLKNEPLTYEYTAMNIEYCLQYY